MAKRSNVATNWLALYRAADATNDYILSLIVSALQNDFAKTAWSRDFAQDEMMLNTDDAARFGVDSMDELTYEQRKLCGLADFDDATNEHDWGKRVNYLALALKRRLAWLQTL